MDPGEVAFQGTLAGHTSCVKEPGVCLRRPALKRTADTHDLSLRPPHDETHVCTYLLCTCGKNGRKREKKKIGILRV